MNVKHLLTLEVGANLTISTEVFTLVGRLRVRLGDGTEATWLFAEEELLLSIQPDSEELFLFSIVEQQLERDDNIVIEQGKEYEFSYEDRGAIETSEGEGPYDEGDDVEFSDFESDDGSLVRIITNSYNGEETSYVGHIVTEEDVIEND